MITREHIQDLLRSPVEDPTLIVLTGRALVVSATDLGTDRYRGAVEIASRDDLAADLAADVPSADPPSEQELDAVASRLDTMAAQLGA